MPLWNPFRPRRRDVPELPALAVIGAESLHQDWKEIGAGGFGTVYQTRHLIWKWDVAVKLLGNDNGTFTDADLLNEAQLMRRAENPYVMRVVSMFRGCTPRAPFVVLGMVMELMPYGSLSSLQKTLNHALPWPLVFRVANQVALGMNYLHSLTPAIFHKDLKPANILLDHSLSVKITDFGLARFENNRTDKRLIGASTPFYAPPDAPPADSAYDVYSYAMLLWSILNTGLQHTYFDPTKGGRPPLEAIRGMQADGLVELVELMERSWSQNKTDRPRFTEIANTTTLLYDMHKHEINSAVCKVQNELARVPVTPVAAVQPVPAGSINREDFLKHSCPLSLNPSSLHDELCLSEDNRTVTSSEEGQPSHPDNQDRFAHHHQVLSSDGLPKRCYFEVKWRGGVVGIAVCYQDISRKENYLSAFGADDKSWILWRNADKYWHMHGARRKECSTGSRERGVDDNNGGVIGVYVGDTAGEVSFYSVSDNTMSPLHTVQTDAARPLHAGIYVPYPCTAEVRKIW